MLNKNAYVTSPCIRECTLDNDDICVGCFRSRQEIINWLRMEPAAQQDALRRCEERKAQRKLTLIDKVKDLFK